MLLSLKKLNARFGIDGAIILTIFTRLIQAGGSLFSIVLIARFLSLTEQGYYYTFGSIIAIQVFFELGLSTIITQYTAHEFAYLKLENNGLLGDEIYKSRLSSLLRFCIKWFGLLSVILFFALLLVGFYFFSKYQSNSIIEWKMPWLILCFATSLNLFIDPILAFFEGLGQVKDIAKVRLIQKSSMIVFLFLFLLLGFKLYACALASVLSILINYFQIGFSHRIQIIKSIWYSKGQSVLNYMKEIFPYQWRIALSWISGYFIFQLFNPVLFAKEGAIVAGQMGMTLQFLNGISALSMSWISTKVPTFSSLISKKQFSKLDLLFNKTLKQLSSVNLLLLIAFNFAIYILKVRNEPIYQRFLPTIPTILLTSVTFINQFVFSWAVYLRCHKKEPYLSLSIVSGILCGLSTLLLGYKWGLLGLVAGYSIITIGLTFPWAFQIYNKKKIQWHEE